MLAKSRRRAESNVGAQPPSKVAGGVVETVQVVAPSSLRCWLSHGDVPSRMSAPSPRSRWLAELLRYAEWVYFEFSQRISEEYSSHQPELMLTPHSDFFTIGLRLAEEASRDPFLESPVEFR